MQRRQSSRGTMKAWGSGRGALILLIWGGWYGGATCASGNCGATDVRGCVVVCGVVLWRHGGDMAEDVARKR